MKTAFIISGSFAALLFVSAAIFNPIERPTDRVAQKCVAGDLMFQTRDGGYGFVEHYPDCAYTDPRL